MKSFKEFMLLFLTAVTGCGAFNFCYVLSINKYHGVVETAFTVLTLLTTMVFLSFFKEYLKPNQQ